MRMIEHTLESLNARAAEGEHDSVIAAAYNAGFSVVQSPTGLIVYATFSEAKASCFRIL